jgi:hypothetical protein
MSKQTERLDKQEQSVMNNFPPIVKSLDVE